MSGHRMKTGGCAKRKGGVKPPLELRGGCAKRKGGVKPRGSRGACRAGAALSMSLSLWVAACSDELPPLPEAVVIVDTDAPVPHLVDRLRVDFFDERGVWIETREIPRREAADWPASFSVYGKSPDEARSVVVRLRAFRDGAVRDYRGERFMERPGKDPPGERVGWPEPTKGEGPRLVEDGLDVTPASEPIPELAIDRLVRIDLSPGVKATYRITLSGACFGTMADLDGAGRTCVDEENERVDVVSSSPATDEEIAAPSVVGAMAGQAPCEVSPRAGSYGPDGSPMYDEEVCVPGGVFVLGNKDVSGILSFSYPSVPERVARMSPFLVDRYEVTVGRWRRAEAEGFEPPYEPVANDGPLPTGGPPSFPDSCTYSTEPLSPSREALPVNCLGWDEARAFCRFHGGDLLTEAQWELVASATGDEGETLYPWGDDPPSCEGQIYGRPEWPLTDVCEDVGYGPAPPGTGLDDVTPLGVHDMGGSVSEWVLDAPEPYDARCWASLGLVDPACVEDDADHREYRGSGWSVGAFEMLSSVRPARAPVTRLFPHVGLRCARPALGGSR